MNIPQTATPTPGLGGNRPLPDIMSGLGAATQGGLAQRFPSLANKPSGPQQTPQQTSTNPGGYTRMETPARQALLTSMLARARGGMPGGAPMPTPSPTVPPTV